MTFEVAKLEFVFYLSFVVFFILSSDEVGISTMNKKNATEQFYTDRGERTPIAQTTSIMSVVGCADVWVCVTVSACNRYMAES